MTHTDYEEAVYQSWKLCCIENLEDLSSTLNIKEIDLLNAVIDKYPKDFIAGESKLYDRLFKELRERYG